MPKTLRIGLCITPGDPYWVLVREAIYQRAEQCGVQLLSMDTPDAADFNDATQEFLGDELLSLELDAIISKDLPLRLCKRLLDSGLPVMYATEVSMVHPLFVSPVTLYEAAQIAAHFLAKRLHGQGRVLITGGPLRPQEVTPENNYQSRINGFCDVMKDFPEIQVQILPCPWAYDLARALLEVSMQELDAPVDAIFGLSDSQALAARDAGRAAGMVNDHTLIVGINGDLLALAAIADGSLTATVDSSAANFGRQMIDLACQAAGQPLPDHFRYLLQLVTAENVAEVMRQKLIATAGLPSRLIGVNRQEEQRRLRQLELNLEVNRRIGSTLDRKQLSHDIAALIREHYGYAQVYVYLWDETGQTLTLDAPDLPLSARRSIPLARAGLLGQAISSHESIFLPDARHSLRFPSDPHYPQTWSRVVLPIRLGDATLGVLDLHSTQPTQHTRHELVGLQLLADQLGMAMRNARLYEEAVQARATAERADQLKTRLLANVSHELRTPLNVILGYSQTALATPNPYNIELSPVLRRDLTQIYKSGEHLVRLINDLLDISRAEIGELSLVTESIAPRSFLEDVFYSVSRSQSTEKVNWLLCLPDRLPLILADTVRLRQIVLNLLVNASKFTTEGHILLGAEVEPPYLHLWVEDTGSGIPAEQQKRIFEPFVTVERLGRRNEGIGLGLAITRRLVALHRGFMSLESQVERGSVFHVYLPLPNLSNQPMPTLAQSAEKPLLLVISANTSQPMTSVAQEIKLPHGWTVVTLQSDEGVEQALAKGQPMALAWDVAHSATCDWMMIQRIRSHPQLYQLPFLLFGWEGEDKATYTTGVMMKPMEERTLTAMIEALRPEGQTGPILIVDDDPQACALYQRMVGQAAPGYAVQVAHHGAEALAALAEVVPALVILDLVMPEVDGFAVLAQIRADCRTSRVPVLVISGQLLSPEDIKRLDHAQVVYQSKDILSTEETAGNLRRLLLNSDMLPQATSTLVKRATAYIQQNYATQCLTRQQIAAAVGVSEDYLGRIFQHELSLSPMDYLNRYRIKEAKARLIQTDTSITAIAAQVGFDDSAYFSRAFSKQVGICPRDFRKKADRR